MSGTHGLSGEVHVILDSDHPENYKDLESVFLLLKGENALIPFFIQAIQIKGEKAIVKFEEVTSLNQASVFTGSLLFLPLDVLPKLEGDDFYFHELVSWRVIDQQLGELGSIISINHQSPQILLVMEYQKREVLIPYTDEIVIRIDRINQQVHVSLPEGLLEIYLEE